MTGDGFRGWKPLEPAGRMPALHVAREWSCNVLILFGIGGAFAEVPEFAEVPAAKHFDEFAVVAG